MFHFSSRKKKKWEENVAELGVVIEISLFLQLFVAATVCFLNYHNIEFLRLSTFLKKNYFLLFFQSGLLFAFLL